MTPDLLADAALRRTAGDATRLGSWLDRHRLTNGWTWADLAAHLGTDVPRLAKLSLCEVPRAEAFADDVTAVAAVGGISPAILAALVRQVEALQNWDDVQPSGTGWTLAAHRAGDAADDGP